ncbi:hypothetical protein [Prevotella sp.]|nr:hypothetical protein [Prevotella sp.]
MPDEISFDANIQGCQELLVQFGEQGVSVFFVLSLPEQHFLAHDGIE